MAINFPISSTLDDGVRNNITRWQRSKVLLQGACLDHGIVFGLVQGPPHEYIVAQAEVPDPRALRHVCALATKLYGALQLRGQKEPSEFWEGYRNLNFMLGWSCGHVHDAVGSQVKGFEVHVGIGVWRDDVDDAQQAF
jgi:hypothetical protein